MFSGVCYNDICCRASETAVDQFSWPELRNMVFKKTCSAIALLAMLVLELQSLTKREWLLQKTGNASESERVGVPVAVSESDFDRSLA